MRPTAAAALIICIAASAGYADSPQTQMFPGPASCYARVYSPNHLAKHPEQKVARITIRPDFMVAKPTLAVHVDVTFREKPGTKMAAQAESTAYCFDESADRLFCGMEGDTGGFQLAPAKAGTLLLTVSDLGMMFETETDFITLDHEKGDDRSFLLQAVACE